MKVSFIIPCYNEERVIAETVERVKDVNVGFEKEIVVVDDGSTDGSAKIVSQIKGVNLIRQDRNHGKGAAVQRGLKMATGNIVVIQDADLEYPPEQVPGLLKPIIKREVDVVYGSRFLGTIKNMTFWHFLGNKILSLAVSLLYNVKITDVMTGHKVFRREVLDGIELKAKRFEFEPEITTKILKNGHTIVEVPIEYKYRMRGKAKINWIDGLTSLWWILKSRFI